MSNLNTDPNQPAQGQSTSNTTDALTQAKKKSLKYSIIEGSAASVMGGFGDSKILFFAIFLNASKPVIGFLSAIPSIIVPLAQLISVRILDRTGNRKALIVPGVFINMLMWAPVFFLPFLFPSAGPILLIIAVVISTGAVNFSIPAWNSLMGDLTESAKRGQYFAKRNIFAMSFSLISTVAAYGVLEYFKLMNEWIGFAAIFGVAFISRGISAYYLNKMVEPVYVAKKDDYFSFWDFLRRSPKSNFARFVFYVTLINFAVGFSGPFFALYMKSELKFSYFPQIAIIDTGQIIISILMMRYWGRLCDRFGNRKILAFTGWLISFVPILWLLSPNFYAIIAFQLFAGLVWSGFSLAIGNFMFDAVSPAKLPRCVAYSTLINTICFCAPILGGWISLYLPDRLSFFGWQVVFASSLQVLFLISGLMRLLISSIFLTHIKEVRQVEPITTWELIYNFSMIQPILGPIFDIFTGGKEDKER